MGEDGDQDSGGEKEDQGENSKHPNIDIPVKPSSLSHPVCSFFPSILFLFIKK